MSGVLSFGVAVVALPLWGWAYSALWAWFVVPVFSVPGFDWRQGVGLTLVTSAVLFRSRLRSLTDEESLYMAAENLVTPVFVLGFGRILAGLLGVA